MKVNSFAAATTKSMKIMNATVVWAVGATTAIDRNGHFLVTPSARLEM